MRAISPLIAALLAALLANNAWAWGQSGHRIVGAIAESKLDAKARAAVAELLAGEPDPTLAGVSVWADHVRENEPDYTWTVPLHWVNFERGNCRYEESRNCRDGLCVVEAIERYSAQLGDRWLPRSARRDALKFVVHFVGDIHQPLHAGFAADRGGNDFQISLMREGWNLHSVWDTLIIDSLKLEWPEYQSRVETAAYTAESLARVAEAQPSTWAGESCGIAQADDFYPPKHKITGRYLEAKRPTADQRLKLAGERLAALLNRVLGDG